MILILRMKGEGTGAINRDRDKVTIFTLEEQGNLKIAEHALNGKRSRIDTEVVVAGKGDLLLIK